MRNWPSLSPACYADRSCIFPPPNAKRPFAILSRPPCPPRPFILPAAWSPRGCARRGRGPAPHPAPLLSWPPTHLQIAPPTRRDRLIRRAKKAPVWSLGPFDDRPLRAFCPVAFSPGSLDSPMRSIGRPWTDYIPRSIQGHQFAGKSLQDSPGLHSPRASGQWSLTRINIQSPL